MSRRETYAAAVRERLALAADDGDLAGPFAAYLVNIGEAGSYEIRTHGERAAIEVAMLRHLQKRSSSRLLPHGWYVCCGSLVGRGLWEVETHRGRSTVYAERMRLAAGGAA